MCCLPAREARYHTKKCAFAKLGKPASQLTNEDMLKMLNVQQTERLVSRGLVMMARLARLTSELCEFVGLNSQSQVTSIYKFCLSKLCSVCVLSKFCPFIPHF